MPNSRTGEDYLDKDGKKKKKKKRYNPYGKGATANPSNMSESTGP